jgi:hypothetical protein
MPIDPRLTSARFAITIDGQVAAQPKQVTGGDAFADVAEQVIGAGGTVRKHLSGLRYRDIEVTCGPDMGPVLRDWISDTVTGRDARKSGSVGILDANGAEQVRLDFENALLTEVALPALDGGMKDPALLHLRISPERVRRGPGDGTFSAPATKTKTWLVSSFRLDIPGLETRRVSRVEPLTVRVEAEPDTIGQQRVIEKVPGRLVVPNLVVTLSQLDVDTWAKWHEDFVINGRNDASQERTGILRLMGADLKTVFVELTLRGLGIFSLRPMPATPEAMPTVQASMYCQQLAMAFPA